jgi:two-component system response regulator WspF
MRIAIVNDLALAVEVLRRVIASMPEHRLAWVAVNGAEAVARCRADRPDLILMDLIMPVLDGVEATRRIMAETPCAILVVTASVTGNQAKVFDALGAGALDAVRTPVFGPGGTLEGAEDLRRKIQTLSRLVGREPAETAAGLPAEAGPGRVVPSLSPPDRSLPFVALGASTGGPKALATVLGGLPSNLPAAVLVVQHLDAAFTASLIEWLAGQTPLPVQPAENGDRPQPGRIYVACRDDHLILTPQTTFAYTPDPRENPYRPSVDVCFQSLAAHAPPSGAAALLTGMGRDGARGLLALRRAGWLTLAQDEASSIIFGMPKAAVDLGAAMNVLPLDRLAPAILNRFPPPGALP